MLELAALAYLLAVTLAAVLMWTLGDVAWPATILLFSGRWVLLIPLALLLPAALLLFHARALLLLVVAALVVVFPVMGLRLRLGSGPAVSGNPGSVLRVVTLNADNSRRLALDLPVLLQDWNPDVVALQECGQNIWPTLPDLDGWHHYADAVDLCLLSRHPVLTSEAMDRTDLAGVRAGSTIGGAGFVVRHIIQSPHGPVRLVNLHLETPRKGFEGLMRGELGALQGNTQLRAIEAGRARRWSDGDGIAAIVLGDFNTPPESRVYRRAWGSLANAFSSAGSGFGYTRYNGWIRVRIDHVLHGPGWRAVRATVGDDVGSDHRPLIVDLVPD